MSGHPDVVQNSLIVPYTKFTCSNSANAIKYNNKKSIDQLIDTIFECCDDDTHCAKQAIRYSLDQLGARQLC